MEPATNVHLSGNLDIKTVRDIKTILMNALDEHKHICVSLDNDTYMDISFVQIMISARHYGEKIGGSMRLKESANTNPQDVLRRGGFLESASEGDHRFWFKQEEN